MDDDDYPDYVIPVMRKLQNDPTAKAILLCRNGVGVSIAANKFKNIRCALCFDEKQAQSSKTDDNANCLALPAEYISAEKATEIATTIRNIVSIITMIIIPSIDT